MKVPVLAKVGGFGLTDMGNYSYYANSIPQIQTKPPEELSLEGGNVTPEQLVKAGEGIFKGKGTCEICHQVGQKGTRAPDLAGIGARAAKRKLGMSGTAYIVESLLDPGAYLVEGYPNIMPKVDRPPIGLNRSEIWALTAFLESLGGTAAVKLDDIPQTAGAVAAGVGASPVGPDLSQIARIQTPEYIMAKILNPAGMGTVAGYPPGVMPAMFGQSLTAREYVDLVSFLLTLKR